jgi:hypothetical protein
MRLGRWITKVIDTHPKYVILVAFHGTNGYAKVPQSCVTRTMPGLQIQFFCSTNMLRTSMEETTVPSDTRNTLCNIYLYIMLIETNRNKCAVRWQTQNSRPDASVSEEH